MLKKITIMLLFCAFLIAFKGNEASAKRIEVKKAFFSDLKKGKLDVLALARVQGGTLNLNYENEIMKVEAFPIIAWQGFTSSDIRRTINHAFSGQGDFIFYANGMGFRGEAYLGGIAGIAIRISNKTSKLLFIDLNKSAITVGSYYGAPLSSANRNHENPNATLPPLLIPPKGEVTTTLNRADFYNSSDFGWTSIFEFPTDKNMLGYIIFAIGEKETEYITFNLDYTVPLAALKKYRRNPGDFS